MKKSKGRQRQGEEMQLMVTVLGFLKLEEELRLLQADHMSPEKESSIRNRLNVEKNRLKINTCFDKMAELETGIRILQAFRVSLIPKIPGIVIPPRCIPGWQEHASRCFSLTNSISKWKEAREACQMYGGDLAVVQDMEDQKFLTNLTYQYKQNLSSNEVFHAAWIGLTDEKTENSFVWVNNEVLQSSITFWSEREPNNFIADWDKEKKGQDCVGIVPPKDIGAENWLFNWDDVTCVGGRHYVCESKAVVS